MSLQRNFKDKYKVLYPQLTWNWTAAHHDQEPIVREIFEKYKPKRILEIGTFEGLSTALFAQLCEHVTTIDIIHNKRAEEVWNLLGVSHKIRRIVCNTQESRDSTIESVVDDVDLCFIDGCHLLSDVEMDFEFCTNHIITEETADFVVSIVPTQCNVFVLHDYGWELTLPEQERSLRKYQHGWPDVTYFVDDPEDEYKHESRFKIERKIPFAIFERLPPQETSQKFTSISIPIQIVDKE